MDSDVEKTIQIIITIGNLIGNTWCLWLNLNMQSVEDNMLKSESISNDITSSAYHCLESISSTTPARPTLLSLDMNWRKSHHMTKHRDIVNYIILVCKPQLRFLFVSYYICDCFYHYSLTFTAAETGIFRANYFQLTAPWLATASGGMEGWCKVNGPFVKRRRISTTLTIAVLRDGSST